MTQLTRRLVRPVYSRIRRRGSEDLVLTRLVQTEPRYRAGTFCFSFGTIRYVDNASLRSQYREIFLRREYDFVTNTESPFILDCGGNIGLSVIRFKQQHPNSSITVFEADRQIADVLRMNIECLGLKEVEIVEAAAWTEQGQLSFLPDGADGGRIGTAPEAVTVECVRLADRITRPVDLLKMDIEGGEFTVLEDVCQSGKVSLIKRIICEIHGRRHDSNLLGSLLTRLTENGFLLTFNHARTAGDLPGEQVPTPFPAARDGKFLLHLYAWRP